MNVMNECLQNENSSECIEIELGTEHFKDANKKIKAALETFDFIKLNKVTAQRYLGCALPEGKRIEVNGIPGNDMACYMDGGSIEVFGNAQDQVANTMNAGLVVIHGRLGDAAGYAMRGGRMFIRDDAGWRVGIHMKQYKDRCPAIVIGGNAGSFLGEYMAGGTILLLGNAGEYLATGMHGGTIYMRNKPTEAQVAQGIVVTEADDDDHKVISNLLEAYTKYFADELTNFSVSPSERFYKLRPATSRPYASLYAS